MVGVVSDHVSPLWVFLHICFKVSKIAEESSHDFFVN